MHAFKTSTTLLFCIVLFLIMANARGYHNPTPLISGSNFTIEFNVGSSLALQGDDILLIEVLSGVWNSSVNNLLAYNDMGSLTFNASSNSSLLLSSPDAQGGFGLDISGANTTSDLGNKTYLLTISIGNNVRISWRWYPHSILDDYTVLGLGLGGVILMVASPTWVALGIRKKGITDSTIENFGYCLILEIIGFGLIIVWLWG